MSFPVANAVRIQSIASALVALVALYVTSLPSEAVLALVAAVLGTGEAAQRVEDRKTTRALYTPNPLD